MPNRWANGAYTSKISRATRKRFSLDAVFSARIAQVRSAILIRATRTSSMIETSISLTLVAC